MQDKSIEGYIYSTIIAQYFAIWFKMKLIFIFKQGKVNEPLS